MSTFSTSHLAGRFLGGRANSCPVTRSSNDTGRLKRPCTAITVRRRCPSKKRAGVEGTPLAQITAHPANRSVSKGMRLRAGASTWEEPFACPSC